ncbi:MAG: alanyl-tRNA editing protein [Chloroflexi bacterium]|nr:alanyl-tRNA editing protein [Chloroflexota bacterium]
MEESVSHLLYYADASLREFRARVVAERVTERGPAVRLNQTAFYPTSGGQPHDTGTLENVPVVDVWEEDDGAIWHLLESELPLSSDQEEVTGRINWARRFDHMQQHTGQHLLSAAFVEVWDAPTVGFHLGSEACTIDLEIPNLTWEAAFRVEDEVNRVVWENRPVTVQFVSQAEIAEIPLRKPPAVEGQIRVVWVKGYDASACGGTHVGHTGEVGLIKITGLERYKGGMRVAFRCGARALLDYRRALRLLQEVSTDLSIAEDELPEAIERIQAEAKVTHSALRDVQVTLADCEADRLWHAAPEQAGMRQVVAHWEDRAFDQVRATASRLCEHPATLALLAVTTEKGVRLVCARSDDLGEVDAVAILREALDALGGRGGGAPAMAQGGAPVSPADAILGALHQALPT